ncbi:type IV inositol polyphosphate 5-phosphatase 11 isoform X2 [Phoenix dactylifera]|uniref:Type IV inositol polyphosphate 5-phosphatase 11 isoform X2 n=1 Tax=Phoenix dactylifera TaxID=42345 RepID=A0A8B7D509_PHODC|nr:type IV inositol polyphosphate 5-phosphatase 11 isoform X2 [Phoenix dactylifera]
MGSREQRIMGNCNGLQGRRKRSKMPKDQRLDSSCTDIPTHEGIKTVGIHKVCEFSTGSVLCLCVVTWNMNGKASSEDFAELVGRDRRFDLLAVGLQEVPRRNVARLLQAALDETHSLLGEATMQSLQLFIFGPKNSEPSTKEMRIDKHAVRGCGGLIGRKKGAVGIYINFNGIRLLFISCHLSAHARNVEERNSQCRHISHSLFSKDRNPYARPSHLTVWLGDLNYRIHGLSTLPVRSLIRKNLLSLLTSKDQLLQEAEKGQVFDGYCEGTLSFKPTYKYNAGSSNYDTSYKIRVPSWTDRILFKVDGYSGIDAVLHSYESMDQIESSDHKPVKAHLCLKFNHV